MKKYEKLVRDRIPEILDNIKEPYEKRVATPEEYKVELLKKLTEEVAEFTEAEGDIKELADILEVVDALKKLPEYAMVEDIQRIKREEKGSFDQKFIVKGEK